MLRRLSVSLVTYPVQAAPFMLVGILRDGITIPQLTLHKKHTRCSTDNTADLLVVVCNECALLLHLQSPTSPVGLVRSLMRLTARNMLN